MLRKALFSLPAIALLLVASQVGDSVRRMWGRSGCIRWLRMHSNDHGSSTDHGDSIPNGN